VRVEHVRATDFRCYHRLDCALGGDVLAIVGRNGAGKTSLLEAVHFGALAWSPRTSDDARVVRLGAELTRVELSGSLRGAATTWAVGFQPGSPKRAAVDGAPCATIDALAEHAAVLVFTPERLAVMNGAPALRRRYLDRAVARSWPRYAAVASAYAGALQQRNQLLRRLRSGARAHDALPPWDAQLAQLGAEMRRARGRFVGALREPFARHLAVIGDLEEPVELRYEERGPEDEAGQLAELEGRRAADIERGSTSVGPHHDELAFAQGARDLRGYGSQGEQRSAVLALLTAEADLVHEVRGLRPVLLLDDVASELDRKRAQNLLGLLRTRGQVLVTATDTHQLGEACDRVVRIDEGAAHPE
jgi:DNA replication and repair protein RecF